MRKKKKKQPHVFEEAGATFTRNFHKLLHSGVHNNCSPAYGGDSPTATDLTAFFATACPACILSHMVQAVDREGTKRHHKISCTTVRKMHQLKDLTGEGTESQWKALTWNYTHTHDCIKKGSDESHFNLTLIVRGKVTWQCNSKLHARIQGKINPTKDTSSEKTPPLPHSTRWHMSPSFQVHSHDSVRRP